MAWFKQLFGVNEPRYDYAAAQALFRLIPPSPPSSQAVILEAVHTGERFNAGRFHTPTLDALRTHGARAVPPPPPSPAPSSGGVRVHHVAIASALEAHAQHPGATFQAASQFNCLEFVAPSVTPEDGVAGYASDRTQGPDCALACAAGTVYRNYFVPLAAPASGRGLGASPGPAVPAAAAPESGFDDPAVFLPASPPASAAGFPARVGQTADAQLDTLAGLADALGNTRNGYWRVRNGYMAVGPGGEDALAALGERLARATPAERDAWLGRIAVGVHEDVQVTFASRWERAPPGIAVTQVYCSAISLGGYSGGVPNRAWAPLACLILDAAYEATLWAAVLAAQRTGVRDVFLTFVGGGVFGNEMAWIAAAIGRAVARLDAAGAALDVHVCHYRRVDEHARRLIDAAVIAERREVAESAS